MKKINFITSLLLLFFVLAAGCYLLPSHNKQGNTSENIVEPKRNIVVGFSQLGAESDWRSANTKSMRDTFTRHDGYELILKDGQQKQANQIRAIRTFIQQEVDYIVLAPVTETGWDTVLQEAKDAGIPVIIVDRMVDVTDESLFTCWVGSDFELEGRKAAEWLNRYAIANNIDPAELHIVNIQGTLGASAQIGRTKGLKDAAETYGWDLLAEVPGEFTQTKGKEAMEALLNEYDNINIVYCENDNEALGAIEAIEAAGKKVGFNLLAGEIMILSFDGVNKEALRNVVEGKIACIAECNPHHGPRVQAIIEALHAGKTPDKFSYVDETFYAHDDTVPSLLVGTKTYQITVLDEEMITNLE